MTNAEKVEPEEFVEVLGEKRKLVYTTRAFILLEKLTGVDMTSGEVFNKLDLGNSTALLYAGLIAGKNLDMSWEEFQDKVDTKEVIFFRAAIKRGMENASSPEQKKSEAKEAKAEESPPEPIPNTQIG